MPNSAKDIQFIELKDMISQLNMSIKSLTKTIEEQEKMLSEKERLITSLLEEIAVMKKKLYGTSREKMYIPPDADQLDFFKEFMPEAEPLPEIIEPEFIEVKYKKTRSKKPSLDEQFKDIEVRQVKVDTLTEEEKICGICGSQMTPIGTEVIRKEVIHIRPQMILVEYIATTYGCPKCKDTEEPQFVKDNNAPKALIEGSYASPSLAAYVFYEKFAKAVPFYRLEQTFEELGAKIGRSAMANWAVQCSKRYFEPMTAFFHRELLKRKFLMMDETVLQVLNEPGKRAESKSYVWLMRSGEDGLEPIVYYHYAPTRSGDVPKNLLKGAPKDAYLMIDGYTGYNKVPDVKRCVCYAHIRRYLYEAIPRGHGNDVTEPAVQGVLYCDKLFEYERRYKERSLKPETRMKRRLKDEKPVVEAFLEWANKQEATGNGKFARAINYIKNRSEHMMTYLEDGRCSLSNNASERAVKPVVIGRKNWLFSASVEGAEASMNIYTIVEMAKLHGISSYKYLEFLLEKRPSSKMTDEELEQLAPWSPLVQEYCKKGKVES